MIQCKADFRYYLKCDKTALKIPDKRRFPIPVLDIIWKFEILLRKWEYWSNQGGIATIPTLWFRFRCTHLGHKLGFSIPINVFGPGLSIAHVGTIVVHGQARVGANCRIQECVTIGATNGKNEAAIIGDNCFLGSGAKVIGNVKLGNNVAIGANAVVVRSFEEDNISLGGVPARVISHNGSANNVIRATEIVGMR